jgi:sortase A
MFRPSWGRPGMTRERRLLAALLIALGISLLLFGSLVAVPYVRSRLWSWTSPERDALIQLDEEAVRSNTSMPVVAPSPTARGRSPLAGAERPDSAPPVQDPLPEPAPPTRLLIPKLGIDAPIVPVEWSIQWVGGRQAGVWEVPDGGAVGWHRGTGPLGQVGNTVLNGHNTTGGEVFRNLYTLEPGDPLTVYSDLEPYLYVVSETFVLPEAGQSWDLRLRNASLLEPTFDERVTLVTCHPYGSLRNRLVVIAVPAVEPDVLGPSND